MELPTVERIADLPNILGYVQNCENRLKDLRGSFTGTKQSYIDRVLKILATLGSSLNNVSLDDTSTDVLQTIRTRVAELDSALNNSPVDVNRLLELGEIILEKVTLVHQLPVPEQSAGSGEMIRSAARLREKLNKKWDEVNTVASEVIKKINEKENEVRTKADEKFTEIEQRTSKIDKLARFVGGIALSGEFTDQAKAETKWVWIWTSITALFGMLTLGLLFYFFLVQLGAIKVEGIPPIAEGVNIALLTSKALITVTLGLITRWASKRANHHLAQATKYRRMALCMHSLDSFVATLEPQSKDRVIAFVVAKLLTEESTGDPNADFDSISVGELLRQVTRKPDGGPDSTAGTAH